MTAKHFITTELLEELDLFSAAEYDAIYGPSKLDEHEDRNALDQAELGPVFTEPMTYVAAPQFVVRFTTRTGRYVEKRVMGSDVAKQTALNGRRNSNYVAASVWHDGARLSYDNWDDGEDF